MYAMSTVSTVSAVYSAVLPPSLMLFFDDFPNSDNQIICSCESFKVGRVTLLSLLLSVLFGQTEYECYGL